MKIETSIIGDRLRLRPMTEADLPLRVQWFNDPDVRKTLVITEQFELGKTIAWFHTLTDNQSRVDFLVETFDAIPIGVTGLLHIDRTHRIAECFCIIGAKAYWGGGFGTEIHSLLFQWAFESLGIDKIWATIRVNNPAIFKVVERLGFKIEGLLRKEICIENSRHDVNRIGLLREEFTPTHSRYIMEMHSD